jgi:hypothetical protein
MLTPKIRAALIGLAIGALAFTGATGIATAARKAGVVGHPSPHVQTTTVVAVEVAPTGDGPAGEAECKRYEDAINSWVDASAEALEALDEKATRAANRNVAMLEEKATDAGCFIIY